MTVLRRLHNSEDANQDHRNFIDFPFDMGTGFTDQ